MPILTVIIAKMVIDRVNITTAMKYESACGFSIVLAYLDLTMPHANGQFGRWNGMSPDILDFLY